MKLVTEIRRENLALLVKEAGGVAAVARRLNKEPSQIHQWLADPETTASARNIGNLSVKLICEAFGKPEAWLDNEHEEFRNGGDSLSANDDGVPTSGRMNAVILGLAMDVMRVIAEQQFGVDATEFARNPRLIAGVYNYILDREEPVLMQATADRDNVVELIIRGVREEMRAEFISAAQGNQAA